MVSVRKRSAALMRLVRPLIAFCLALLWMPLTAHCGLEAAGLLGSLEGAADSCCGQGDTCSHDGCSTIEDGEYTPHAPALKVPPPALADGAFGFYLSRVVIAPPVENVAGAESVERPLAWVSDWHFVRRAASPPRAPTLIA